MDINQNEVQDESEEQEVDVTEIIKRLDKIESEIKVIRINIDELADFISEESDDNE